MVEWHISSELTSYPARHLLSGRRIKSSSRWSYWMRKGERRLRIRIR